MQPRFFRTPPEFRGWLEKRHREARELWVGFHKKSACQASITWPEAVDEALCFGWIDGQRKGIDEVDYAPLICDRTGPPVVAADREAENGVVGFK
jgi:uncharacterized protein YdeI (YjbR/CyaY-like superfamily)